MQVKKFILRFKIQNGDKKINFNKICKNLI